MTNYNFEQNQLGQAPRRKMSSLMITVAVHAIALGFALQASNVIDVRRPIIIDTSPVAPPLKPVEPVEMKEPSEIKPTVPLIQPPFIDIVRDDQPTITVKESDKIEPKEFEPTSKPNSTLPKLETNTTRAPVHIAAQVDSNACEKPEYPASSIRNTEEGTVNLAMLIGPDGRVLESKVEKSSGSRALDRAAIQGLSLCKFKPGSIDGVPEKSWAKLQYVWTLN